MAEFCKLDSVARMRYIPPTAQAVIIGDWCNWTAANSLTVKRPILYFTPDSMNGYLFEQPGYGPMGAYEKERWGRLSRCAMARGKESNPIPYGPRRLFLDPSASQVVNDAFERAAWAKCMGCVDLFADDGNTRLTDNNDLTPAGCDESARFGNLMRLFRCVTSTGVRLIWNIGDPWWWFASGKWGGGDDACKNIADSLAANGVHVCLENMDKYDIATHAADHRMLKTFVSRCGTNDSEVFFFWRNAASTEARALRALVPDARRWEAAALAV